MSFNINRTTAPTTYPVEVTEVKDQLKLESSDADKLIKDRYLPAAVGKIEGFLERSLITQTWTLQLDKFPKFIQLPYGPVQSVTSVKYYNSANALTTLTANTDYRLDKDSNIARIEPVDSWPSVYDRYNAVEVIYVAGYGAAVPAEIKAAILAACTTLHENRGDSKMDFSFAFSLCSNYKIYQSAFY